MFYGDRTDISKNAENADTLSVNEYVQYSLLAEAHASVSKN